MKYQITKLDRRHSYSHHFDYMIEFSKVSFGTSVLSFDKSRRWFNEIYGWGQDIETRSEMATNQRSYPADYTPDDINKKWAYSAKYNCYRIYVASDQELNWFVLSHPITT